MSKKVVYENPEMLTGHFAVMQSTGYRSDLRNTEKSSWTQHRALDAHVVEMPRARLVVVGRLWDVTFFLEKHPSKLMGLAIRTGLKVVT